MPSFFTSFLRGAAKVHLFNKLLVRDRPMLLSLSTSLPNCARCPPRFLTVPLLIRCRAVAWLVKELRLRYPLAVQKALHGMSKLALIVQYLHDVLVDATVDHTYIIALALAVEMLPLRLIVIVHERGATTRMIALPMASHEEASRIYIHVMSTAERQPDDRQRKSILYRLLKCGGGSQALSSSSTHSILGEPSTSGGGPQAPPCLEPSTSGGGPQGRTVWVSERVRRRLTFRVLLRTSRASSNKHVLLPPACDCDQKRIVRLILRAPSSKRSTCSRVCLHIAVPEAHDIDARAPAATVHRGNQHQQPRVI